MNDELVGLDVLLGRGSIDEYTQTRLKKLLEICYERKREETREKYGFADVADLTSSLGVEP